MVVEGLYRLSEDVETMSVSSEFGTHEVVIIVNISILCICDKSELEEQLLRSLHGEGADESWKEHGPGVSHTVVQDNTNDVV